MSLIQLASGAIQIIGPDGKATKTIGIMSEEFGKYSLIISRGMELNNQNIAALTNYTNSLKAAQSDVDNGKTGVLQPPMPRRKVISDEGGESVVDFEPPLPTLKPKAASPGDWNTGSIVTPGTVDYQKETYKLALQTNAMMKALYAKEFPNG